MELTVLLIAAVAGAAASAPPVSPPGLASALPLAELPPQQLARGACALFLWDRASGRRIAMVGNAPAVLRVMIDGRSTDLPQDHADGAVVMGFAANASYRSAARRFDTRLIIEAATAGGGVVRDGSLTITADDGSAIVTPVAGIAGCRP